MQKNPMTHSTHTMIKMKADNLKFNFSLYKPDIQYLRELELQKKEIRKTFIGRCCQRVPTHLVISYKSDFNKYWAMVPLILSLMNAITIPLETGYGLPHALLHIDEGLEYLIDFLFILDNVLIFFTTYQSKQGYEVGDHYLIAKNYVRSWRCLFDSMSLLGSYIFVKVNRKFRYFRMLKVGRVFEIGTLIKKSNKPLMTKGILKSLKVVLYLCLYIHWIACFWK